MQFTPLHRLLGRAPAPLSDEMIDEAVSQGIAETDDLDWKFKRPPAKGKTETDYPKDIAAMANSGGGMIVYGITEKDKKATGEKAPRS
jgi:predicted HTH transcriptional regulator